MELNWTEYDYEEKQTLLQKDSTKYATKLSEQNYDLELIRGNVTEYELYFNKEFIGMLVFSIGGSTLIVDSIEIQHEHRGKGHAKNVLDIICQYYTIDTVIGCALVGSLNFWNALGANINKEKYIIHDPKYMIPFKINFNKQKGIK